MIWLGKPAIILSSYLNPPQKHWKSSSKPFIFVRIPNVVKQWPFTSIHGFNSAVDSLVSEKKLEEITLCKAPLVQESSPGIGDEGNYLGYPVAAVKKPVTINGQPYDILQLAETDLSRNPWPIQSSENSTRLRPFSSHPGLLPSPGCRWI